MFHFLTKLNREEQIQALYDNDAEISPEEDVPGKVHILLTNPRIIVAGETATDHLIHTETINDTVYPAPRLIEQGREDAWFKKVAGRWLMTKRLITQDGGLPPALRGAWINNHPRSASGSVGWCPLRRIC